MFEVRRLALLATVFVGSCQDYLFEQQCPEYVKEAELVAPAVTAVPADILFVVDNSCSMADEQQKLADNFDAFIRGIPATGDYRLAVVTTDLDSAESERMGEITPRYSTTPPTPPAETRGNNSEDVCSSIPIEHGCLRGPSANERIVTSEMTRNAQHTAFTNNVKVGSCGAGNERGLAGMKAAIERTRSDQCNAGFLRDDANLVVVIVSDENDHGPDRTRPQTIESIASYVDFLGGVKPRGFAQVRVAVVVGSVDGEAELCRVDARGNATAACGSLCAVEQAAQKPSWWSSIDRRNWDNENGLGCAWCTLYAVADCCSALAGNRYVDFARAMEAEIVKADPSIRARNCRSPEGEPAACLIDSICQESFAGTLERIATSLAFTRSYKLDPRATFPAGVTARLRGGRFGADGKTLVNGTDFSVGADGTSLTLLGDNAPAQGESLEVHFTVEKQAGDDPNLRGACVR